MFINQIVFGGNLGADAIVRDVNGTTVVNFSVANSRSYTDASGEKKQVTVWMRVSAWGKVGAPIAQYLVKGKKVIVVGRLEDDSYTDKDGNQRDSKSIRATDIILGDSPREGTDEEKGEKVDFAMLSSEKKSRPAPKTEPDFGMIDENDPWA